MFFNYLLIRRIEGQWKNLKPELVNRYEIIIPNLFSDWLKATLTVFWNNGKDRFIFKSPPARFENLEDYHIRGKEITLSVMPFKELELFLGFTHLNRSKENIPYALEISFTSEQGKLLMTMSVQG